MDAYLGEIKLFPFNFAPRGWAICQGQLLPINQNSALFSLLGVNYGGDGRTTFALPDLRGRVMVGPQTSQSRSPGFVAGVEGVTLTQGQIPAHNHSFAATSAAASLKPPLGRLLAADTSPASDFYAPANDLVALSPQSLSNSGGGQPHSNMQPYLVLNYCIALQGIFPSRN